MEPFLVSRVVRDTRSPSGWRFALKSMESSVAQAAVGTEASVPAQTAAQGEGEPGSSMELIGLESVSGHCRWLNVLWGRHHSDIPFERFVLRYELDLLHKQNCCECHGTVQEDRNNPPLDVRFLVASGAMWPAAITIE